MKDDFKNINSTKKVFQINISNNRIDKEKEIEKLQDEDPLFDLINQHKKRLLEIKEWQNDFNYNNIKPSKIDLCCNEKNTKNNNQKSTKEKEKSLDNENTENNIKSLKDFLKLNSLNKSNINTENNEESSITINNINYNNIINSNNENNLNEISYSILKESIKKEIENNKTMDIIEQKAYNKEMDFKNKFLIENIRAINNNSLNNTKRTSNTITNKMNFNLEKSLEYKLEKKRIKIKNLKSNIDLLTKENQDLKQYINELEKKLENISDYHNNDFENQGNVIKREQDMLNKINLLSQEIIDKNELIEKMKNMDKIKIKDIQTLSQKCRDLEIIARENNNEKIEKLLEENNNLKNIINNTDKIMIITNYFVKKIYNLIPSLCTKENFESIKEPFELQKFFIEIENFISEFIIYNSNKRSTFFLEFERNKNYNNQTFINLDKEKEKEELQAKINEINQQNIILLKEIQAKKNRSENKKNSSYKSKGKKNLKLNIKGKKSSK